MTHNVVARRSAFLPLVILCLCTLILVVSPRGSTSPGREQDFPSNLPSATTQPISTNVQQLRKAVPIGANNAAATRVLVTGGAGFIGSSLVAQLLLQHVPVVIVDSLVRRSLDLELLRKSRDLRSGDDATPNRTNTPNMQFLDKLASNQSVQHLLTFYQLDISKGCEQLSHIFTDHNFSVVVHLAALAGVPRSVQFPLEYVDANVKATTCLLQHIYSPKRAQSGSNRMNVIIASSSSVYGERLLPSDSQVPSTLFSEDAPLNPYLLKSPYAASKLAAELMVSTFHNLYGPNLSLNHHLRISTSILRLFTVYGPRARRDMSPFIFLDSIARGWPITLLGNNVKRDFTFVDDVVSAILKIIVNTDLFNREQPRIFNIAGGQIATVERFLETVHAEYRRRSPNGSIALEIVRKPAALGDLHFTGASLTRAKEEIGYAPRIGLEEGIAKMVDWYLAEMDYL